MQSRFEELTDSQWKVIEKILDDQREREHSLRTMMNAILWVNRTGLQWRELGRTNYPCWQSVYYYFRKWTQTGVWE